MPAGVLTIGWGHTGSDVVPGMLITEAEARALLDSDLNWAEEAVEAATTTRPPNDNEFAGMVSLAFNIGAEGFRGSTVLKRHLARDEVGAAAAFALWRKIRDPQTGQLVDSPGLIRRRNLEAALYMTPAAEAHSWAPAVAPLPVPMAPMPQEVVPPAPAVASKTVIAGGLGAATAAASMADQIDQVTPIINSLTTAGLSLQSLLKLGGAALSIVAFAAVAYMLWRYLAKRRKGEVLST